MNQQDDGCPKELKALLTNNKLENGNNSRYNITNVYKAPLTVVFYLDKPKNAISKGFVFPTLDIKLICSWIIHQDTNARGVASTQMLPYLVRKYLK